MTIVSGSQIIDSAGSLVAFGTWSFNGTTLTVTNGAFQGSITSGTGPVVITSAGVTILTIPNVTIGGGWFDWNAYKVSSANGVITGAGAPRLPSIAGAIYTQTDGTFDNWTSVADGGSAIWSNLSPSGSALAVSAGGQTSGTADLTALNSTASVSTTAYLAAGGTFALSTTVASNTGGQYRADYFIERVGQ